MLGSSGLESSRTPGEGGILLGPVVLGLLALTWVALLLPSIIRSRVHASPIDGVRRFEATMGVLENSRRQKPPASGRYIMIPRNVSSATRRRGRVIRRRRQNFVRLLALAGGSLVLGLLPHLGVLLWVNLAADVGVGLYVWRLLEYKKRERQKAEIVTELHEEPGSEPSHHAAELG